MNTEFLAHKIGITIEHAEILLGTTSACVWGIAFNFIEKPYMRTAFSLSVGLITSSYCYGVSSVITTALPALAVYYLSRRHQKHPRLGLWVTTGLLVYCLPV